VHVPLDLLDPGALLVLGIGMNVKGARVSGNRKAVWLAIVLGHRAVDQWNVAFHEHVRAVVQVVQAAVSQYKPTRATLLANVTTTRVITTDTRLETVRIVPALLPVCSLGALLDQWALFDDLHRREF